MMFVFYHLQFLLLSSCASSLILSGIFAVLTRRHEFKWLTRFAAILGVLQFTFVAMLILWSIFGYKLQVAVAQPYIQQALDKQCPLVNVKADESGFRNDSGFQWKSSDGTIACYFNSVEWICNCAP